MNFPWARTTCGCQQCVKCCKKQPGALIPGQMEEIAAHLGKTLEEVKPLFWASPGALVGESTSNRQFRVGTITPRYDRRKKRCVFLTDDDKCSIHAVSPAGCALVDTHMSGQRGHDIGLWVTRKQQEPEYQRLRSELPFADHYKGHSY